MLVFKVKLLFANYLYISLIKTKLITGCAMAQQVNVFAAKTDTQNSSLRSSSVGQGTYANYILPYRVTRLLLGRHTTHAYSRHIGNP